MEPITLITTAIALATPYLLKTGESIAEGIGEDIWKLIKKPFTKDNETSFQIDVNQPEEKSKLENLLLEEINKDSNFKQELEKAVEKGQKELNAYQQNINNNGEIGKQINIQSNSGNIQM
jgi:predicted nucleotide-binding protein (sugar kinase/HSP70/actin superfamily)